MAVDSERGETIERPSEPAGKNDKGAKARARNAASAARDKVSKVYGGARETLTDTYEGARETVSEAYSAARERTAAAYDATREKAAEARRRTAEGIDESPLVALVGGIALGAVAAAVLPRTRREIEALGPLGTKLNGAARDAVDKVRSAGKEKIGELGLDRAKDSVRKLVDEAVSAASGAAGKGSSSRN